MVNNVHPAPVLRNGNSRPIYRPLVTKGLSKLTLKIGVSDQKTCDHAILQEIINQFINESIKQVLERISQSINQSTHQNT